MSGRPVVWVIHLGGGGIGDSGWDLDLGLFLGQVMAMTWPRILGYNVRTLHRNVLRPFWFKTLSHQNGNFFFPPFPALEIGGCTRVQGGCVPDETQTRCRGDSAVAPSRGYSAGAPFRYNVRPAPRSGFLSRPSVLDLPCGLREPVE